MRVVHKRCAGLDVHQKSITACVRVATKRKVVRETRVFGTATSELLEMLDWLGQCGCTIVAMEATGVYWKPVWHVLEGHFELVLAQPAHVKNMPGRKSDISDALWIADLLAHGLIRASFVPPTPIQELRELTRTRKQFVREIARETQRIQKTLEDANIKLTSVISTILGVSGRAILRAIIAGESDPHKLSELGSSRLKATEQELSAALEGYVTDHHRFLLGFHLNHIEQLEASVSALESRITESLRPFRIGHRASGDDSRASVKPRRPFSSPRSDPMSRHSQRPDTFALGPVYAHGFMRVPVNAFLRKPAKGLHGSRPLLSKPLGRQAASATAICVPSSSGSNLVGAPRKLSSPSPPPSSPPSTTCSTMRFHTGNWVPITSINATRNSSQYE